jgi:hypothetical protein
MVKVKQSLIMFNPTLEKAQMVRKREKALMSHDLEAYPFVCIYLAIIVV